MEPCFMLSPDAKIAIFMEDAIIGPAGKMGFGVLRYSEAEIVCVVDSTKAGQNIVALTGIQRPCPIVGSIDEAFQLGADVLILGIAPSGGLIPEWWWPLIDHAVMRGLSIVNGLHNLVGPRYPHLAKGANPSKTQFVWDVRVEPVGIDIGKAEAAKLTCARLLLIGSDMAVGKMTTGLEIQRVARERGIKTGFVATGQIGITITGAGIPLDAIRVDFASGAVEGEVLRHAHEGAQLVVIEGQGSLVHPSSTANLPLIRGACPTHYILCHRAGLTHLKNLSGFAIPDLKDVIKLFEQVGSACGMFQTPRTVAMSLNTAHLNDADAIEACAAYESDLGIPCVDPLRHGAERLVDSLGIG
jgi:uncharacterized NAD-dependent epimerase/dehydratase family protein